MQYRKDRYDNDISVLGFGCMRFSRNAAGIKLDKAEKEIMTAVAGGVNYFDTAYIYPGSEAALGEILYRNNIRDKVYIASKLPHYLIKSTEGTEKIFKEELKRLKTDHIDYYLMHMLTDKKTWDRLCSIGIREWIENKKAEGKIKQIGFSYHGNSDMFCELVDAYDWDFCQIQYNYLDENSQAGITGLKYAAKKGIPVIIMEPLRGGKLCNKLPKRAEELFNKYPIKRSPAEWAFRWLWDQPEVTCVLSGMNSEEMVRENIRAADEARTGEFGKKEFELIGSVVDEINKNMAVGCTGCRYCMPCPQGVDIPGIFAAMNREKSDGKLAAVREYMMCTAMRKDQTGAMNCIGCGKCEKHCPQGIKIREELKKAAKSFEKPVYKAAKKVISAVMKY